MKVKVKVFWPLSLSFCIIMCSSWKGSERTESTRLWNKALIQKERLKRNSRIMKSLLACHMFAFKNCRQLRCKVQGQTIYICLPCVLCCSFIDFDPLSGFTDLLDGCKIVVCHSSRIHNEPTRSPWIGRLRRTGAIFSFLQNSPSNLLLCDKLWHFALYQDMHKPKL